MRTEVKLDATSTAKISQAWPCTAEKLLNASAQYTVILNQIPDTPDEMQNSQNGHELDTDVDMHEAPASPA